MNTAIVTIGNFDGVHLGHQMLVDQVVDRAAALGRRSYAVTFDPHPQQVLFPEHRRTYLTSAEERAELLRERGVDEVWVCPFTTAIARLEPEEFLRMVSERQPVAELWVGADFALGRGRSGTISVLAELGGVAGWALHMVPPLRLEGQVVSSTAIRTLLGAGAVRGAAELLGRAYRVSGDLTAQSDLRVDPLRTLPRPLQYVGQLFRGSAMADVQVTVVPDEARLEVTYGLDQQPLDSGPARLDFIRRGD